MRQARKREILSFIDSLQQAHGEIKEAMGKRDRASAQVMLAECQEFAVELGKTIEETEGESCVTVSHVEEYCETLFRVFEAINSSETGNSSGKSNAVSDANRAYKLLKKQLLKVENSVKNDIPLHREVVFFPYKASMWDSLESIYMAAKKDSNCVAYCVPIPYFDLNTDHSFGIMHYEGSEYPKDIEIVDWKTYHFEERRPDAIFIHNPYDEWNNVTSVHPRFYAKNLREYTDQLVYIPYFILNEIKLNDTARREKVDAMKHFCFTPGTIYAHKVIVQSEDMRQIYIDEYIKEAGQLQISVAREKLEEKILGLGSPKIDKVENTRKEELDVPEEWLKVIEKPDGTWKKIIFYNTGISALLSKNERWIDKIENVFEIMKKNQDNVALIWRPHPLIENTIRSMRPELLLRYEMIREQYKKEQWGIYDNTADLDRSIAMSDVYYGDGSSVIQLFLQIGKPIMVQNVNVLYKD